MHTMGYKFKPWRSPKTIADAPSILEYLNETVDEFDLRKKFNLIEKSYLLFSRLPILFGI